MHGQKRTGWYFVVDYLRTVLIDVAGLKISKLKISFEIQRESSTTPVAGNIIIHNLNRDHERQILEKKQSLILSAGYETRLAVIFDGKIARIDREFDFDNKVRKTSIEIAGKNVSSERLSGITSRSFEGEISLRHIITLIVEEDLELFVGALDAVPVDAVTEDYSFSGTSTTALNELLNARQVKWFEHDGIIKFNSAKLSKQADSSVIDISPKSGLIGSPTVTDAGGCRIRTLLKPDIKCGDVVNLSSRDLAGAWKVTGLTHFGDNWDGGFFTDLSMREQA